MAVRLLPALIVLGTLAIGGHSRPANAKSVEAQAEMIRLQGDISRLIQRNAWKGVERAYQAMLELGVVLRVEDHLAGEHAARIRGDITTAHSRLTQAVGDRELLDEQASAEIKDALARIESIEARYGRVDIQVHDGRIPALVRFDWPFAREERVSIEIGRETLGKEKALKGFLPIGKYMIDGHFFEVSPGNTVQDLQIKPLAN